MRGVGSIKQGKLAARRRRRAFYICLYTVAAADLVLSGLSYLSGLDSLLVKDISITGNSRLATATIEGVARNELAGTYWHFFSRQNALIYPRTAIRNALLDLPLANAVTVERSSMNGLLIKVAERQTTALWCDAFAVPRDCYAVDGEGFIFDRASAGDSGFIYKSALALGPIGYHVVASDSFKKIQFFMTELAKLAVEPREVALEASSTYMTIGLAAGGRIIVNSADDLSTVLGNISAIVSDKSVAPDLAKFLAKLDYMRLDVGNKVVFKQR